MSSKISERFAIVMGSAPASLAGAAQTGDYVSMAKARRCLILIPYGDGTHATNDQIEVKLYQATTAAGGSAKVLNALETGRIYTRSGANYATYAALTGLTKVTQATADEAYVDVTSGNEVGHYQLEIDASDLDADNGFCFIRADLSATTNAKISQVIYILETNNDAAPESLQDITA